MQLRSPHRGSDLFMCLSRSVWFAVQRQSLLHGAWRVCSIKWYPYPSNTPPLRKLPWVVKIDSLYSGKSNFHLQPEGGLVHSGFTVGTCVARCEYLLERLQGSIHACMLFPEAVVYGHTMLRFCLGLPTASLNHPPFS